MDYQTLALYGSLIGAAGFGLSLAWPWVRKGAGLLKREPAELDARAKAHKAVDEFFDKAESEAGTQLAALLTYERIMLGAQK